MKFLPLDPPRSRPEEPEHPFDGQLVYQGVVIDVENRAGSYRRGVDPDGKPWASRMPAHYGEVRGTTAPDGDAVDVFVGPDPYAPFVWVFAIKHAGTDTFDEHKAVLGASSREDAMSIFKQAYDRPYAYMMSVKKWPFASWAEAMKRPHIARSKMQRPLVKGSEVLVGGLADGKPDRAFAKQDLEDGVEHEEAEHTADTRAAKEIAKDHLAEDPDYYRKIEALEKGRTFPRLVMRRTR